MRDFVLLYKIFINRGLVLLLLLILTLNSTTKGQEPGQQQITSEGKEFWLAFMSNEGGNTNPKNLKVYITSTCNATGTISVPLERWTQSFSVSANGGILIAVPQGVAYTDSSEVIERTGIHIVADTNITVWGVNNVEFTTDGTNVLPTATLGQNAEYIVASYKGISGGGNKYLSSEFIIVSTEDSTEFTFTPSVNTLKGKPANIPDTIILDKGYTYPVMAKDSEDLTGTTVGVIKGNIALFSGTSCADVPGGCTACDHLYKQCFPINSWGEEYIIVPFLYQSGGYLYRVIASEDSTTVSITGLSPFILDKGGIFNGNITDSLAINISADKPVCAVQYMKGGGCNGIEYHRSGLNSDGDPAMLVLNSNNQMINEAVFESATTTIITQYEYVNIITKTVSSDSIVLDGKLLPKFDFNQVPQLDNYSYAMLEIEKGVHTITSKGGFIAYAYGIADWESYLYGIGGVTSAFVSIQASKNPVCKGDSVTYTAVSTNGGSNPSYQWKVNGGQQLTGSSDQFTYVPENNDTVTCVLISNEPGITDNKVASNAIILKVIAPVVINPVFHNQGACTGDSLGFTLNPTAGTGPFSYQWQLNGANVMEGSGGTSSLYYNKSLRGTDDGTYSCIISNTCNTVTSKVVTLSVSAAIAINPSFYNQSQCKDSSVTFTLNTTAGSGPFSYQWLLNGKAISGGTNSLYSNLHITTSDGGTYSCIISNACNSATGDIVSLSVNNNCNRIHHEITGYVYYDNTDKTPMSSETAATTTNVYLYNTVGDTIVSTAQTADNGYYEFADIPNGSYYVSGSTKKAWGGVNPTDALIVNRDYIGMLNIRDTLLWQAGDVDSNMRLNPTDALIINRRYIGLLTKYPKVKDWKFQKIQVNMDGANLSQDILAVCSGDVNASYVPPARVMSYELGVRSNEKINIDLNKPFDIPVYLDDNVELGAIGIKLLITNDKLRIIGIKSYLEGLVYNLTENQESRTKNQEINIAWAAVDEGFNVTPDKPLLVLRVQCSVPSNSSSFQLPASSFRITSESELADIDVNIISTDKLAIPKIVLSAQCSVLSLNCYPNPFNEFVIFNYELPESCPVLLTIYDIYGKEVAIHANEIMDKGVHETIFNADNLSAGMYYYRLNAGNNFVTGKIIRIRN